MKYGALVIGMIFSCVLSAEAKWVGYDEGAALSRTSGKLMIVDFSTDWCGWCKKMDQEVFSEKTIAARLSRDFVTVRLDAESSSSLTHKGKRMEARQFAMYNGVEGFPTLIVFDSKENAVSVLTGYVDAQTFGAYLDYLRDGQYRKISFDRYLQTKSKK